jgi:RNA polymerase sigma-70 factor (ECF subfamily)
MVVVAWSPPVIGRICARETDSLTLERTTTRTRQESGMSNDPQTQEWLTQIQQGDDLAVSKLLATLYPALKARTESSMERLLRARYEPEDILQQAFLDVFRNIHTFEDRGPDSFFNWVLTILDRKLIDARRALHRQARDIARELPAIVRSNTHSYVDLLEELYVDTHTPSRVVRQEEAVGALIACLSRLSDSHQRVLTLRFLEGRPVEQVADMMGKTDSAIVALTKRALDALRRAMDQVGEFTRGC